MTGAPEDVGFVRVLGPVQVVLLVRGVCKGEPTATLARELGVTRGTVHDIRKAEASQRSGVATSHALAGSRDRNR